ncbi:MAG: ABC transporter ATP-binding protein [Ktedonobacterales bacterium]|nr:ABC transporter ATP-binding protein [Ktedonobacterales bacterium]
MQIPTWNAPTFLRAYLGPQWRQVGLLLLSVLASIAADLANPLLVQHFIDLSTGQGAFSQLITIAIIFLVVAVAGQGLTVAATAIATRVSWRATNRLRTDLTRHCLNLDLPFHATHAPGELVERVDGDVTKLGNFFSHFVVQVVGNLLLLAGIIAVTLHADWRIGTAMATCAIVTIGLLAALRSLGVRPWEAQSRASADLYSFIEERLSGMEDLRALGATTYVMRGLAERWRRLITTLQRATMVGSIAFWMMLFMLTVTLVVTLGVGLILFGRHEATIGTLYLIFAYATLLQRPVEELSRQLQDLQQASASLLRTTDLLSARSAIAPGVRTELAMQDITVTFDQVDFRYHSEQATLTDISFAVPARTTLGVVGRTGSGKTTLTRLLFRFYDPQAGTIRLNGTDVRDLALATLRSRIGLVTQDIQLFHASIRDNLTFFDATVPEERIIAALTTLGLGDWLSHQPQGVATLLAPDGTGLSAGEAQLLSFARVFLQDPAIIVLDEASSRLDPATERIVAAATARLLAGKTAIIIAHRLHTLQQVDAILVLEDGVIQEYGPRAELARRADSQFARLLQAGIGEVLA